MLHRAEGFSNAGQILFLLFSCKDVTGRAGSPLSVPAPLLKTPDPEKPITHRPQNLHHIQDVLRSKNTLILFPLKNGFHVTYSIHSTSVPLRSALLKIDYYTYRKTPWWSFLSCIRWTNTKKGECTPLIKLGHRENPQYFGEGIKGFAYPLLNKLALNGCKPPSYNVKFAPQKKEALKVGLFHRFTQIKQMFKTSSTGKINA